MSGTPWTHEDLEFLRREYQTLEPDECAKRLGRTKRSIANKALVLKITKDRKETFGGYDRISQSEWDMVRDDYARLGYKRLSELTGRSISTIKQMASALGVQYEEGFVRPWSSDELALMRSIIICKQPLMKTWRSALMENKNKGEPKQYHERGKDSIKGMYRRMKR